MNRRILAHGQALGALSCLSHADGVSHLVIQGLIHDLEATTRERDAMCEALHAALDLLHHTEGASA